MDGRWKQRLAAGILLGVLGCRSHPVVPPPGPLGGPAPGPAPIGLMSHQTPVVEKTSKNEGPLKLDTLITLGNVRAESARDPNRSAFERDELLKQASQAYQQVLARDPKNLDAHLAMARLHVNTGEKDKAIQWFDRAAKAHPRNPMIWKERGVALGRLKDWDVAAESFHEATKFDPDNRELRWYLGMTLARGNRYSEAFDWLRLVHDDAWAHYQLAGMMAHNNQFDAAKAQLAKSLQANPEYAPAREAMAAMTSGKGMPDTGPNPSGIATVGHEEFIPVPESRLAPNARLISREEPNPNAPAPKVIPRTEPKPEPKEEPKTEPKIDPKPATKVNPAGIYRPEPAPLNLPRTGVPSSGWDQ